ncbi:hypothetical protein [Novosphingobium gossypii]|uniref:hypothetical protein n=1 Tax=Novosphingobium gossypii TaxID=1604774 RepID=UPI003D25A34E
MNEPKSPLKSATPTKEERLAAKLRENLRRRKAQARAVAGLHEPGADGPDDGALGGESPMDKPPLAKSPLES